MKSVTKIKLTHIAVVAASTLTVSGCLADESNTDADQAQAELGTSASAISTDNSPPPASLNTSAHGALTVNFHQIVNLAFSQCMDAPNGTLNVVLRIAACTNSDTQKWAFVATSSPGIFNLVNKRSGFCAEVNNGTSTAGELVDEFHCDGGQAEQWVQSFRVIDGVTYQQFRHAGTQLCLDTVGAAGSQLMQFNCGAANDAQTWLVH
jgi:hypothetical protein